MEKEIIVENEIIVSQPSEPQILAPMVLDWADLTEVDRTADEDCKDCD